MLRGKNGQCGFVAEAQFVRPFVPRPAAAEILDGAEQRIVGVFALFQECRERGVRTVEPGKRAA